MKKTYKKNKVRSRNPFRKTLKRHKKHIRITRKNRVARKKKMQGGTGGLYAYPAQANFWEEGVSKFRSSPAYLSGGSKIMPLPVNMPVFPWNNVWGKKSAIFDQK